ncbi:hypothetical protein [Streptomyces albidochromogenes]|uniref:Uncharacterized protein n=1 Tax=Streptomyces albidochromogenes TaxID=329524 RepID=A0ABW6FF96_9ACTN
MSSRNTEYTAQCAHTTQCDHSTVVVFEEDCYSFAPPAWPCLATVSRRADHSHSLMAATRKSTFDTRPNPADPQTKRAIVGVCRIGEHEFCDGNQDIKAGGVVAAPLRCACTCHREHGD